MSAEDRIKALAAKAAKRAEELEEANKTTETSYYNGCAEAYEQSAKIVAEENAVVDTTHPAAAAAAKFCSKHCFYSRQHGPGSAAECGICPLVDYSADQLDEEDEDSDARKAAIAQKAAKKANQQMERKGIDTMAYPYEPVRRGSKGMVAG